MDKREIKEKIGKNIQALRNKKGMSQEMLAEAIGKSTEAISSIERGKSSPRVSTAIDIAAVLEVPLKELFCFPPTDPKFIRHQHFLDQINELTRDGEPEILDAVIQAVEVVIKVANPS